MYSLLCYFDNIHGPRIFLKDENLPKNLPLSHIPFLMDLYKEGFFLHEFSQIRTANLIFEINNPAARGRKELLMLSIVSSDRKYDLTSFQEILEYFALKIRDIPHIHRAFYEDQKENNHNLDTRNILTLYFNHFNQGLPSNQMLIEKHLTKVATYTLTDQGRSHILTNLEQVFTPLAGQKVEIGIEKF